MVGVNLLCVRREFIVWKPLLFAVHLRRTFEEEAKNKSQVKHDLVTESQINIGLVNYSGEGRREEKRRESLQVIEFQ